MSHSIVKTRKITLSDATISAIDLTVEMRKAVETQFNPNDPVGTFNKQAATQARTRDVVSKTDSRQSLGVPRLPFQSTFIPAADDRYHIDSLLKFEDAEFVKVAYCAILKRPPDAAGHDFYLEELREGRCDKLNIIIGLRFSDEGKQKNVQLEGLALPRMLQRLGSLPLLGYPLRFCMDLLRLPIMIRRLQQSQSRSAAQTQKLADYMQVLIDDSHNRVEQKLADYRQVLIDDSFDRIETRISEFKKEFDLVVSNVEASASITQAELREVTSDLDHMRRQVEDLESSIRHSKINIQEMSDRVQQVRREQALQAARVDLMAEAAERQLSSSSDSGGLKRIAAEADHRFDTLYAELEDRFRGSRDDVKAKFEPYLPYVKGLPNEDLPIVDLGCGRGEWLELLKEEGLKPLGVDNNRVMLERCRERKLEATESDMLAYLRGVPAESLRAVTGFHIIEHLPLETLLNLLDEIVRTLQPGGLAIFETPNPDNLFVGSNYFYCDPTHRNPLPNVLMKVLLEARGFQQIEVVNLHPCHEGRFSGSDEVSTRLNDLFYGPMDYAIMGWKLAR